VKEFLENMDKNTFSDLDSFLVFLDKEFNYLFLLGVLEKNYVFKIIY
jgi:hypothetical protein